MASSGCQSPKAVLPPVGDLAVPEINIAADPPRLQPFTESEFKAIPLTAHGKILKYIADVNANWDIAKAAVKAYRDYLKGLFKK